MPTRLQPAPPSCQPDARDGKILVLLAVVLPSLLGIVGLVIDGGLLAMESRRTQGVTDAAALAAARRILADDGTALAIADAQLYVRDHNSLPDAAVEVSIPPTSGAYAGVHGFAEVVVRRTVSDAFVPLPVGGSRTVSGRAVAGVEDVTDGVVLAVLDRRPEPFTIAALPAALPALPGLPAILGGLEVLGIGSVKVEGAVVVNNEWGGLDEHEEPCGILSPLYRASWCTPLLPLTRLRARNIRVAGGVDNPHNYGHVDVGEPSPLRANVAPVPDPLRDLPAPTTFVDPVNVVDNPCGGRTITVIGLPLISPPVTLQPGVYEWITVVSGRVIFEPGVYVIRGVNPLTGISLSVLGGRVKAEGVMFYVTNSGGYSVGSGLPDAADGETEPAPPGLGTLVPSIVVNAGLLNSSWSPLDDPASPFDGMLFYQRRADRRPIVVVSEQLLSPGGFAGTIYAKWGHALLALNGTHDLRIAAGTVRFANVLGTTLAPTEKFPPVREISLVE